MNTKKLLFSLAFALMSFLGWGQNGTLNFGNPADGTTATTSNTGFGGVRVGTGGGGFTIMNPGQSIGSEGELKGIAPTGGSINSVGVTSTEYGTEATMFTIQFELYLSGGNSGTWYFFAGNGTTFGSSQTNTFTSNQVFTGLKWSFESSNSITTNNRNSGDWNTTGITGTPFAQNTSYIVTIVGNNSSSSVNNYSGSNSVAANKYDLWINGTLVGNDLSKGELTNGNNINAFRFYGENSESNVATIALDNISWYNICTLPSSSSPTITTSVSSLTGFTYTVGSGPSAEQSFQVSGSNLTANIDIITANDNYEFSTTSGGTFTPTLTLTQSGGSVPNTTVYVRLKSGLLVATYDDTAVCDSSGAVDRDVSLSGSVTAVTNSSESDIITANGESATVSSIENDATITTTADGVQVWQFTIRDGGSDLTDADALATIVNNITFSQNSGNSVDDWADAIQAVALFNGTTKIANGVVTSNQISFSGSPLISVPDNSSVTLSVRLSIQTSPNNSGNNLDGDDFVFNISNTNVSTDAAGSSFAAFPYTYSANGKNVFDVVATQLSFSVQPSNVGVNSTMVPNPKVSATDVNGNLDKDFTGSVNLTSTGTATVTSPVAASAGIATFTNLVHSATGTGLTLTASATGLTSATSNPFDVTSQTLYKAGELVFVAYDGQYKGPGNGNNDEYLIATLVDMLPSTEFTLVNSRYEAGAAAYVRTDKWGGSGDDPKLEPGWIRLKYNGASAISAGSVLRLQTQDGSPYFDKIYVTTGTTEHDKTGEFSLSANSANIPNISSTEPDQIWLVQGTFASDGSIDNNQANYILTGTVLHGLTNDEPWVAVSSACSGTNGGGSARQSRLHPSLTCFNVENNVSGAVSAFYQNSAPHDGTFRTIMQGIGTSSNWTTGSGRYTVDAASNAVDRAGKTFTLTASSNSNGTWVSTGNTDWFLCSNWEGLTVPDETTDVSVGNVSGVAEAKIDDASTYAVTYANIAQAKNLSISGSKVTLEGDANDKLEVHGNLTITAGELDMADSGPSGQLYLYGNWSNVNASNFKEGESTVHFVGTSAQTVTCNTGTEDEHFYNVVLNNPTGFTTDSFNNDLHAKGNLTLSQGNLTVKTGHYALAAKNVSVAAGSQIMVEDKGSLIQTDDAGTVTGGDPNAYKIVKTTGAYYNYDYIYWSSPVDNLNIQNVFSTANGFNNYKYKFVPEKYNDQFSGIRTGVAQTGAGADGFDDEGDDWTAYSSGVMDRGLGYIVMGQGSPSSFSSTNINTTHTGYTVNFTGQKVNNGSIDVVLHKDKYHIDSMTGSDDKNINLNLVGNPYPSAISLVELNSDNTTNIEPNFYFWTHEHPISNTFLGPWAYNFSNNSMYSATVSGTSVTTTNPLGNNPLGLNYTFVASGQAFFVQAKNTITSGTTTLNFNNSMRDVTYANTSFRNVKKNDDESLNRIWLSMTKINGDKNFIALGFGANNTDDLSLNDVYRVDSGNDTEFYSVIPDTQGDFDIQFLSTFSEDKTIPLGMEILTNGNYSIQVEQTEGVFLSGQAIYLEDTYQDIIHDLSASAYSFTQTAGTNINDRFVLRFTNSALSNEETTLNEVKVYPNPSTGLFNVAYYGTATLQYTVYDLTGKTVFSGTGNQINLSQQALGLYFAKITDGKSVRTVKLLRE